MFTLDITHCNRGAECRAKATAAHFTYRFIVCIDNVRPFTYWGTFLWQQPDTFARHSLALVGEDCLGAREPCSTRTLGTAHFGNRPQQTGFDRSGLGIHVMAIQAQAGFQAQRVARAQADRLYFRLGQQAAGQSFGALTGTEIS